MTRVTVKAENIPRRKLEQLASPLLKIVAKAFEDPKIQEEFGVWQESKGAVMHGDRGEDTGK